MARLATMTVWDVQLGLAIHVKAPNGKYIVIDLGTGTYESGNSTPILKRRFDNIAYLHLTALEILKTNLIINTLNVASSFSLAHLFTHIYIYNYETK